MSLVLSIFPGIGLLDMAFEEEGFVVVRGPDVVFGGDVRNFYPPPGRFDGVIGGPPCQSFSALANLVRANGHQPRFGDLFPEFARCVAEAQPDWFLAENVDTASSRAAGEVLAQLAYGVTSFRLDNSHIDSGDALGEEQERCRRFWFGLRGRPAPDLRRWIQLAALLLPRVAGAVTQTHVDNSQQAKGRTCAVTGREGGPESRERTPAERERELRPRGRFREQAVLTDPHAVPVAIGGSGKRKPGARVPVVTSSDGSGFMATPEGKPRRQWRQGGDGTRSPTVGGHLVVYRWERMLELQGLPLDFLKDAPFTVEGKRKAVANGVPLPMGRTIARAVKAALAEPEARTGSI